MACRNSSAQIQQPNSSDCNVPFPFLVMEIEAERGLGPVAPIIAPRVLNYRLDFRAIPSCGTIFVAAKAQHIDWLLPDYVLFTQSERYRLVPESCHRYSILQANLTKLTFSILKRVRGVVQSQRGCTDFNSSKKILGWIFGIFRIFFFWFMRIL